MLLIPESDRPQYALRSYSEIAAIVKSDTTVAKKIDSLDDKRKKVISEMGSLPDLVSRVESARKSHVERQEVLRRDSSRIEGSIDSLRQKSLRFIALDSIRSVRVHSITLLLQTKSEIEDTLRALDANFKRISSSKAMYTMAADTLVRRLRHEIEMGLVDTLYSGPSVRPSDLVIDPSFTSARILYRNYKRELRYMPALDPAERMGIFRIRYVPFPVAGLPGNPKTTLRGPFGENPTVFEVGLAFGDAIVPGDEFVVPEFSSKRLGVAFAVTEKLFNDDARIIGLVLTYDFNSYGSIGIGGNFAQHETNPYFSFGINKKAFEAVLSGLAGLFK